MNGATQPVPADSPNAQAGWFPSAGRNSGEYQPGQKLTGRLARIRQILPLPLEQIMAPDLPAMTALADKIRGAGANAAVIQLAHRLTSRELDQVFPLLAILSPQNRADAQLTERLHLVIRERACPTLYTSGWLVYQKNYPARIPARALHLLCRILTIRQQSKALPAEVREIDATSDHSPAPLISTIGSPVSRQLVRRLVRHLDAGDVPLTDIIRQYGIREDFPFGAELIAQAFICGCNRYDSDGQRLFAVALKHAPPSLQTELLRHFFRIKDLPPGIRNRYCQQIYRQFGDPAGPDSIWKQMRARDRRLFREWVFAATIGTHCRQEPEKARLYQRYANQIIRIEHWDKTTLLIHFPGFLIADNSRNPLLALYYSRRTAQDDHPFELANSEFQPNPADPAIPRRQVDDAIRKDNFDGIIGLPFDPAGIRQTGTFLGLALGGPRRRFASIRAIWRRND